MSDREPSWYGDAWAEHYDDVYADVDGSMIDLLAEYAGTPPRALELGIGTGRVALPLVSRGVDVAGIEGSEEMIHKLRGKPGGGVIEVFAGDLVDVDVNGQVFPLVYFPFNTFFSLLTQERQVQCFANVSRALEPGGRFVLEGFVPDLGRYDKFHTRLGVSSISSDNAHAYELSIHDPVHQRVTSHHVRRLDSGETVVLPVEIRYCWPSELDLMAKIAGLGLEARWGWYDRRPFNEESTASVSVYRKPVD